MNPVVVIERLEENYPSQKTEFSNQNDVKIEPNDNEDLTLVWLATSDEPIKKEEDPSEDEPEVANFDTNSQNSYLTNKDLEIESIDSAPKKTTRRKRLGAADAPKKTTKCIICYICGKSVQCGKLETHVSRKRGRKSNGQLVFDFNHNFIYAD
jgi:hypothetical protein